MPLLSKRNPEVDDAVPNLHKAGSNAKDTRLSGGFLFRKKIIYRIVSRADAVSLKITLKM